MEKWWSILPKASQGLWAAFYWQLGQPSQRIEIRVEALLAKFRDNPFTLTLSLVWQLKAGQAQVVKQDWHSRSGWFFKSISYSMSQPQSLTWKLKMMGFFKKENHSPFPLFFQVWSMLNGQGGVEFLLEAESLGFCWLQDLADYQLFSVSKAPEGGASWLGKLVIKVPSFFSQWLVVYDMKKSPKSWHVMRYLSKG